MAAWYSPSSLQAACGPVLELVWSPLLLGRAMGQFVSGGEQVAQSLAKCNSWLSCEFLNTVVVWHQSDTQQWCRVGASARSASTSPLQVSRLKARTTVTGLQVSVRGVGTGSV